MADPGPPGPILAWPPRMGALQGPGPLPLLAFTFAAGVWLAATGSDHTPTALAGAFFPLALLALAASRAGRRRLALVLLAACFLIGGAARRHLAGFPSGPGPAAGPCAAALVRFGLPPPDARGPSTLRIEGEVIGPPRFGPRGGVAEVEVARAGLPRERPTAELPPAVATTGLRLQLFLPAGIRPFAGDRLLAEVALDEAALDGPAGADRLVQLGRRGIACVAKIVDGRAAVVEPAAGWLAAVEAKRRALLGAMRARLEPGPASSLVLALAVGDRAGIDAAQNERFADSGLAHLLSVSGLHLALTVLGAFRLLAWGLARTPLAARLDPLRVAAALALPLAPAYALLTGASVPVLRAAVAAGLYLIAHLAGRAPDGWSALAAALLAILACDPAQIFDPSLQLSFAACWGLLALGAPLRALLPLAPPLPDAPRWRRWLEWLVGALLTTCAATLATLPFTALHFERTSLASLPANVAAVPVGLVATVLGAIATAAGLAHERLLDLPLWLAWWPCRLLDGMASFFAGLPGARLPLATDGVSLAALTLLPLAIWLSGWRRRLGLSLAATAVVAVVIAALPPAPDGRLHVEFLPVGQGDCTLLRLPDGSAILVDAGGDPFGGSDVGATRVLPQLRRRGVRRLAAVAVSHLHPDHVGGIPAVLRALEVGELWTTGRPLAGRWAEPLAAAAAERGVPRRLLAAGDRIEMGGVRIEVLGPPDAGGAKDDALLGDNDASLVLRIVHGDVAILLPGDVEAIGEWALLDSGATVEARLLKAPHHGSRTSSTPAFIDRVRPDHVVFCVGHRNRFGFPHDDVVQRYQARRCTLHRTDHGPVHFVSDGSTLAPVAR